jgi:hypothetical protein
LTRWTNFSVIAVARYARVQTGASSVSTYKGLAARNPRRARVFKRRSKQRSSMRVIRVQGEGELRAHHEAAVAAVLERVNRERVLFAGATTAPATITG